MKGFLTKEAYVNSITDSPVIIQTSSHAVPSTPSWFGEVVVIAHALRRMGVLEKISERVRFTRRRFGRYEVIDFLAVLFGYAVTGEQTLDADLTTLCIPLRLPSWRSSYAIACLPVRHSRAFWPL